MEMSQNVNGLESQENNENNMEPTNNGTVENQMSNTEPANDPVTASVTSGENQVTDPEVTNDPVADAAMEEDAGNSVTGSVTSDENQVTDPEVTNNPVADAAMEEDPGNQKPVVASDKRPLGRPRTRPVVDKPKGNRGRPPKKKVVENDETAQASQPTIVDLSIENPEATEVPEQLVIPTSCEETTEEVVNQVSEQTSKSVLVSRLANDWMKRAYNMVVLKMLCCQLFWEYELGILFADTGVGKTILGIQIACDIASGNPNAEFTMEATAQPVLYIDGELSLAQFKNRYSDNFTNSFVFPKDLHRCEIDMNQYNPKEHGAFHTYLVNEIEKQVIQKNTKVIIIDNISCLRIGNYSGKAAAELMAKLNELKKKYNLSILVIAHTPKRKAYTPITQNDLNGSKILMNLCDSAFAIGKSSTDDSTRYIKQIKGRNTEEIYGSDNVINCQIVKKNNNFLQFEIIGYGSETDHIQKPNTTPDSDLINRVMELYNMGKSYREIAAELSAYGNMYAVKVQRMIEQAKKLLSKQDDVTPGVTPTENIVAETEKIDENPQADTVDVNTTAEVSPEVTPEVTVEVSPEVTPTVTDGSTTDDKSDDQSKPTIPIEKYTSDENGKPTEYPSNQIPPSSLDQAA